MLGKRKQKVADQPARRRVSSTGTPSDNNRPSTEDLSNRYAFRRNRTITGSSSANVASSNELNAELQSPRAHVHHLTSLRRRLLFYFSVAATGAFGIYLLLTQLVASQTFQVSTVGLPPGSDTAAYNKAVDSYYAARPAERLRFALNQKDLLAHIQASRPEVKSIRVEQGGILGEAVIMVSARSPIARWSINGDNQYVDDQGIVFARSYFGDPGLQIIDNSGAQANNERLVASNRFLGFVGRVIAGSNSSGLKVSSVTIPVATTRQITLSLVGKPTQYKLSVDRSAGQQVEDIARVDRFLTTRSINPAYVDVRIAGKAYYK